MRLDLTTPQTSGIRLPGSFLECPRGARIGSRVICNHPASPEQSHRIVCDMLHGSHAMDRGASLLEVQTTLGPDNIATTRGYLHARPDSSSGLKLDHGVFLR
jgi:hypothetical protein